MNNNVLIGHFLVILRAFTLLLIHSKQAMTKACFKLFIVFIFQVIFYGQVKAQSSDDLFLEARDIAFNNKDYKKAIQITKKALLQSPDYTDISIFLGRLYTWSDHIDSARTVFQGLQQKAVDVEDFYLAYGSLEYWQDNYSLASALVNEGLGKHPKSEDLALLKARIEKADKKYPEALESAKKVLEINPSNTNARSLIADLKEFNAKNAIGINYTFSHFDKQFEDNWHIVGLSYKRVTPIGSVIIRGNLANKFGDTGSQLELEAYPRISKTFYLYTGIGYSEDVGIFPKFRAGASLYANLPSSFEAEVGFRHLKFDNSLWMYTASVGKYYKNFWFNFRTFLTPDQSLISHSYTGTVRYYTKGAFDYIALIAGSGISPEESNNNLLDLNIYKLKTFKIGSEYSFTFKNFNNINISAMYFRQEYQPNTKGNQVELSLGYFRNF